MKKKKLPKQIFAIWEEGTDGFYLSPAEDIDDLKYAGAEIGVYELKKIRNFKLIEEEERNVL